jgi:hypothetical protein
MLHILTHMFQLFYLYVVYVLPWLFKCFRIFLQVFQMHVSSVSFVFRCILQMFHLNVSKVYRGLHMLQWCRALEDSGLPQGFASYLAQRASPSLHLPSLPSILPWHIKLARKTEGCGRPCVWAGIMGEASRLGNAESERMAGRTARSKSGNGEWPVRALALLF